MLISLHIYFRIFINLERKGNFRYDVSVFELDLLGCRKLCIHFVLSIVIYIYINSDTFNPM